MAASDVKIRILAQDKTKKALSSAKRGLNGVKSAAFSMKGALLSIGAGAVLKGIIDTASSVESLKVRLKFLTGSTEDAAKAFDIMFAFASRVPFALADIQRASAPLLTVADSVEELNELLEITGDIAVVSGLSFAETAMQMQRAMSSGIASADQFRERGVAAFLGFTAGVSVSGKETKKILKNMWRDGSTTAKGATLDLAATFQGQVSMMQDAWFSLQLAIADTGVFEQASKAIIGITKTLQDPEMIKAIEQGFGAMVTSLKFVVDNHKIILAVMAAIKATSTVSALLGRKMGLLAGGVTGIAVMSGLMEDGALSAAKLNAEIKILDYRMALLRSAARSSGDEDKINLGSLEALDARFAALIKLRNAHEDAVDAIEKKPLVIEINYGRESFAVSDELLKEIASIEKELTASSLAKSLKDDRFRLEAIKSNNELTASLEQQRQMIGMSERQLFIYNEQMRLMGDHHQAAANQVEHLAGKLFDEQKAFEDAQIAIESQKTAMQEYKDAVGDFGDRFIDTMTGASSSFSNFARSVIRDMAKMQLKKAFAPMFDAIGTAFGSFMTGGAAAASPVGGGAIHVSGTRASGGTVTANNSFLVGEKGAELFIPSRTGTIVPNDKMGGSSSNVVVNVTADSVDSTGGADLGAKIGDAVRGVLIAERRAGGILA